MTFDRVDFEDRIIPRDARQERAWEAFSAADCGVLNIACGGGKSALGLKKIAQRGYPAIVIVNNESLVEQWIERAGTFLNLPPESIGIVQGAKQEWDKPLVLAMVQTLASRIDDIPMWVRQRYGTVIFDECHHFAAATFCLTAGFFFGARFGLTATTERTDRLEEVYYAHLGPVIYSDKTSEIYADVYFKPTGFSLGEKESLVDFRGMLVISRLYNKLAKSKARNKMITADAADAAINGRKVLVLSHSVAHVEELAASIAKAAPGKKVGFIHGAITGNKRLTILAESDVTVASFSLAKEGLDVPRLDALLLATPFRDWGAFQQCKGRVERAHPLKKPPIVVVYEDADIPVCRSFWNAIRKGMKEHGLPYQSLKATTST
jgi:superfamily II DNA or RNA helicase